MDVSD